MLHVITRNEAIARRKATCMIRDCFVPRNNKRVSQLLQSLLYRLVNRILYPRPDVEAGKFAAHSRVYAV